MGSEYHPPNWAGNPKRGLHLDVVKGDGVLQKLLIDEKSYYLFGRNSDSCDFPLQHQSCSRVHAALVHHKNLHRPFLIDLGSAHGTFVGSVRLEQGKPQQLLVDSMFRFGASTRLYVLREKPQPISLVSDESNQDSKIGLLLGLTDLDHEVDDLTQYNTAHNRHISTIGILEDSLMSRKRQKRHVSVSFNDGEEIINPEDTDPTIGRFRNMIQTSIVPIKRPRISSANAGVSPSSYTKTNPFTEPLKLSSLCDETAPLSSTDTTQLSFSSIHKITSAPPVVNPATTEKTVGSIHPVSWTVAQELMQDPNEPKKKKYAKEAWPGKKPSHLLV